MKASDGNHTMYFIAILCPPEVEAYVLSCKQWMKAHFGCIVAMKSPAHITLIPPFWFPLSREAELITGMQHFTTDGAAIDISLNGFSHFGKRVIYIVVEENSALGRIKKSAERHFHKQVGSSVQKDQRDFHPHVTIANRDLRPENFQEAWQHFKDRRYRYQYTTNSICLLRLTEGRWEVLATKEWTDPDKRQGNAVI